jgi:hypothetical protein
MKTKEINNEPIKLNFFNSFNDIYMPETQPKFLGKTLQNRGKIKKTK